MMKIVNHTGSTDPAPARRERLAPEVRSPLFTQAVLVLPCREARRKPEPEEEKPGMDCAEELSCWTDTLWPGSLDFYWHYEDEEE